MAIAMNMYKWLNFLWIFKRNKLRVKRDVDGRKETAKETIPFTDLFTKISKVCEKDPDRKAETEMRKVCDWLTPFDEYQNMPSEDDVELVAEKNRLRELKKEQECDNILQALLKFQKDPLCIENMGYYEMFLNQELFLKALEQNNEIFIQ